MVPVEEAEKQVAANGEFKEGMYKIGYEIPAGEYKVIAEGNSFILRSSCE